MSTTDQMTKIRHLGSASLERMAFLLGAAPRPARITAGQSTGTIPACPTATATEALQAELVAIGERARLAVKQ